MNPEATSERELIRNYINGNHASLQVLIERHQQRLYSYIFLLVKDKQLADDIFQDTYVKVINTLKLGNYKDEGKFIQWVMRIAHNLVIDHFRKAKKIPYVESNKPDFDVFDTLSLTDPSVEERMVQIRSIRMLKNFCIFYPRNKRK